MNPLPPHELFSEMTPESIAVYKPMLQRIMLNLRAVQLGMFDTLMCETEDPAFMQRWRDALPRIVTTLHERRMRGLEEDDK